MPKFSTKMTIEPRSLKFYIDGKKVTKDEYFKEIAKEVFVHAVKKQ